MAATSIPLGPHAPKVPADASWDEDADSGSGECGGFGMIATLRQGEAEPAAPEQ
jgi:hypothetical protein